MKGLITWLYRTFVSPEYEVEKVSRDTFRNLEIGSGRDGDAVCIEGFMHRGNYFIVWHKEKKKK